MPYSYAFSILLSAFLLFQVQPMMGKFILPWFGGTPTVWSTVLLFFQSLLTGGYAYAYWLLGRRRSRQQGAVHLALLGISLALLVAAALAWPSPLTPAASWRPQPGGLPVWDVFRVLAVAVGAPYLLLAANSTLAQGWFSRDEQGQMPYRLYALSNAGSLVGLVSYPLIFEPNLTLRAQAYAWSAGYVVFVLATGYLALRTFRRPLAGDAPQAAEGEAKRPGAGVYALWLALAACASALLIAVSNQITQEVAPIPFLWVLPLTVYLLTFILAFSGGRWYSRRPFLAAFFVIAAVSAWMLVKYPPFGITAQIAIYTLLLFVCCMICHGELFGLRPHPRFLSSFYLMVALGGALGGVFVNLVAPYLFSTGFWELQWGVVACGVLVVIIMQSERTPAPRRERGRKRRQAATPPRRVKPAVVASAAGLFLLSGFTLLYMRGVSLQTLLAARNYYGVVRVWENNADDPNLRTYELTHGKTAHGFQFANSQLRPLPTTYYAETSGVGLAILNHPARPGGLRVGALGLGAGVIAAYGQPGDVYRFYEINPTVISIAEGQGSYFSFLQDSAADVQVVAGDARISLERELESSGPQGFDVLVLDTFNGDAMPMHLLTKEAFAIYLQHLKPGGIVAINVSNRYFNLSFEVYRLADAFNLETALIEDHGDGVQSYDSIWMLLSGEPGVLEQPAIAERSTARPDIPAGLGVWTDDRSNLLQILK